MNIKHKLLAGIGGLLLTGTSMFAGWGISVGVGVPYVPPPPPRVVAVAPAYPYYAPRYYVPAPYPVYAAPVPATYWVEGFWHYGPRGRYWVPGHWARRRY